MCIVQGETESIKNTNIFVGEAETNADDRRQFTVYSNKIKMASHRNPMMYQHTNNNHTPAMILPVPSSTQKQGDIKIIDMSKFKNIFKQLNAIYKRKTKAMLTQCQSRSASGRLDIERYGNYDVSIVPKFEDFERLNHNYFQLEESVAELLRRDYSKGFSFIVCKLKENSTFHPFGYTHPMINNKFFIPTKHFHNNSEAHADWDHNIYVLKNSKEDIDLDSFDSTSFYGIFPRTQVQYFQNSLPSLPLAMRTNSLDHLKCIEINDQYKGNHDMMIKAN